MNIPNPEGLLWGDWADTVVGFNPDIRVRVDPNEGWRQFAERVTLPLPKTPRHDGFEDWREWARAFKLAVQ